MTHHFKLIAPYLDHSWSSTCCPWRHDSDVYDVSTCHVWRPDSDVHDVSTCHVWRPDSDVHDFVRRRHCMRLIRASHARLTSSTSVCGALELNRQSVRPQHRALSRPCQCGWGRTSLIILPAIQSHKVLKSTTSQGQVMPAQSAHTLYCGSRQHGFTGAHFDTVNNNCATTKSSIKIRLAGLAGVLLQGGAGEVAPVNWQGLRDWRVEGRRVSLGRCSGGHCPRALARHAAAASLKS